MPTTATATPSPPTPPTEAGFRPFSATHLVVVLTFAAMVVLLVWIRRRRRDDVRAARRMDATLALLSAVAWVFVNGWWFLPANFDPRVSLPLHMCDIIAAIVPFALLWPKRWLRALLYFWGLGLSIQGFITPDLHHGPRTIEFWMFWSNHFVVVGIAIYDLAARSYVPSWRDWAISAALGFAYVALILPIDLIFHLNYGYLAPSQTGQPTVVNYLGPWPWRIGVMIALGLIWTALLVLPWKLARGGLRESFGKSELKCET